MCNRQFDVHIQRLNWQPIFNNSHHHLLLLVGAIYRQCMTYTWQAGYRLLLNSRHIEGTEMHRCPVERHALSVKSACSQPCNFSTETVVSLQKASKRARREPEQIHLLLINDDPPYTVFTSSKYQNITSFHGYRNNQLNL